MLVLKTHQLERLRTFYSALGIRFKPEQHGKGPIHHAGQAGGMVIEIYPLPDGDAPGDSSTRLGFAVSNLSVVLRELAEFGAEIISPPKETAWGLRAIVRDPDGRAVEIQQQ